MTTPRLRKPNERNKLDQIINLQHKMLDVDVERNELLRRINHKLNQISTYLHSSPSKAGSET